jgi:hypothetical protein
MIVVIGDRVQKLKDQTPEIVTAKPPPDFDAVWERGFVQPDVFAAIVCNTLTLGIGRRARCLRESFQWAASCLLK